MRGFIPKNNSFFSSNSRLNQRLHKKDLNPRQDSDTYSHSKNSLSSHQISHRQDSLSRIQKSELAKSRKSKFTFPLALVSRKSLSEKPEKQVLNLSISPIPHLKLPILSLPHKNRMNPLATHTSNSERKKSTGCTEDKTNTCSIGTCTNEETNTTEVYKEISLSSKIKTQKKMCLRAKDLSNILEIHPTQATPDVPSLNRDTYAKRLRLIKCLRNL